MTERKVVARFYDPEEAHIALGFLRSHGLDVSLADEHALAAMPELRVGMDGYRIFASRSDAHMAETLLAQTQSEGRAFDACENCGGEKLQRVRDRRWPLFLFFLGALFPFSRATGTLRCRECGHKQPAENRQDEA